VRAVLREAATGEDLLPALDELIDGLDLLLEEMRCV